MASKTNSGGVTTTSVKSTTVSALLTRPANTNTYTADDALTDVGGAALTFADVAREDGGNGWIS